MHIGSSEFASSRHCVAALQAVMAEAGETGQFALHAVMHAARSRESAGNHIESDGAQYIHTISKRFRGGLEAPCGLAEGQVGDEYGRGGFADGEPGGVHSEAGDPVVSAPIIFRPRDAAPGFPCHINTDFQDADFLAAPTSASRRRRRRRSRAVRLVLRHRAPDAAGDAACESTPVRAAIEMRAAP